MTDRKPGKHAFAAVFVTVLIDIIGFGIIIPVGPDLIIEISGETTSKAVLYSGALMVVFALVQFVSTPILGGLSDRFGRRPVILFSLLGYAVDFAIMGFAKTMPLLFLGRFFSGIFAATYATANAYIADITPQEQRAVRFGMLGAAFGIGFIIGPVIGGFLGERFGTRAPFFAASLLAFINFVYCYFALPETLKRENRRPFDIKRANPLGSLIQLGKYPVILPVLVAMFLFQLAHFALQATWAWYGKIKFEWGPDEIGLSLAAVGLSAAIVQGGLIRILMPILGEKRAVLLGGGSMIIAFIGYAFASEAWMVYPLIAIGAIGGLLTPSVQGIMTRTIPENAQGELQGAIASIMSLTMIIGPFVMSGTFSYFTSDAAPIFFPGASFLLAGILVTLAGIPMLLAFSRIARPREDSQSSSV